MRKQIHRAVVIYMDSVKIGEYNGRDIFFDPYCHKYYVWHNGKKVYRISKDAIVKYIAMNSGV